MKVGDVGFLPVQRQDALGDFTPARTYSGHTYTMHHGFTRLAVETPFLAGAAALHVLPFPPPGLSSTLSDVVETTPMIIPAGSFFRAPALSRLTYPHSTINIGDTFAIPETHHPAVRPRCGW